LSNICVEESCTQDTDHARGYQPELPTPKVFGEGAKDERFSAVLSKKAAIVGLVANEDK
jgi:hypothetical protein